MKRMISLLLAAALLPALLSACQAVPPEPPERQSAALEVVDAMLPVSGYTGQSGDLERLTAGEDGSGLLAAYLENAYGLSEGSWEDAAIIRAVGASAFELAVLRLRDDDEAARAAALFASYLTGRQGDFAGYAPEQAELVAGAGIAQDGAYAALCVCPDPGQAAAAFHMAVSGSGQAGPGQSGFLSPAVLPSDRADPSGSAAPGPRVTENIASYPGRCDFVRPNKDDMSIYDTSAILAAWANSDPSSLSGYDRDIFYAAQAVLNTALRNGMNDLEKETAIYSWIVNNVNYDWTHQDVMQKTPRESFTPYGGLVNRTSVCLGYATTFQLLMDLAGVECITVTGAAFNSQEDHGWNMVRLNGNWYCVDVTWDANYREYGTTRGRERDWIYFNITSDMMARTDHQWDYANIPEAVTKGNGRR